MIPRDARAKFGPVVELHPDTAVPIKDEPGTLIWREKLSDGTEAAIKLYRRGFIVWCRGRLTVFRAQHEFGGLRQLESLEVAGSPPLFWAHGHFGRHGWGDLLATRWLPDSRSLADLLTADPETAGRLDLAPLWATVGRLHDAGLRHGTLFVRNILIHGDAGTPEIALIDMPRFHRFPYSIRGTRMARYDLLYLGHSLLRLLPGGDLPRWLAAYGMAEREQAQFQADLQRFRNTSRLRRVIGAEFNLRALLAGGRKSS